MPRRLKLTSLKRLKRLGTSHVTKNRRVFFSMNLFEHKSQNLMAETFFVN